MSASIKLLVLEAIRATLDHAQRSQDKNRPIKNISAESICRRFFVEKEERWAQGSNSNVFWLTAMIETEDGQDLEETAELQEIIRLLNDGFIEGYDHSDSGQFKFDVSCNLGGN